MELITLASKNRSVLIPDVVMHPLYVNRDESGILVETLRTEWKDVYGKNREFAMQYFSVTKSGVARDEETWHCHPTVQDDRFVVAQGEIVVAIADNRKGSKTFQALNLFHMQADRDPYMLLIPKGFLHGFMVVSKNDAVVLNFPTSFYNPSEERRVSFDTARIKTSDGSLFSWSNLREQFSLKNPHESS